MGRKPKPKPLRLHTFQTSVLPEDYERLEDIARANGVTLSSLTRDLILEGLRNREKEEERKLKNANAAKIKDRILQQYAAGEITREDAVRNFKELIKNMHYVYLGYEKQLDKITPERK